MAMLTRGHGTRLTPEPSVTYCLLICLLEDSDMTTFQAIDFKDRKRDPKWERELLVWLRQQPESLRVEFLLDLVNYQVLVALQLANKALESRESHVELLEHAVTTSDASSIRYWLESLVPRLGFRRSSDVLLRLASSCPEGVDKAFYWMPRFASSEKDQEKLQELRCILESNQDDSDA